MSDVNYGDAAAIIDAMEKHQEPAVITPNDDGTLPPLVALSTATRLESTKRFTDELRTAPERVKGTAVLDSPESFIDYVKAFAGLETKLFASANVFSCPSIGAIIDHHGKGPDIKPSFCTHRARHDFQLSDEWLAWTGRATKSFPQKEFAEFIEDHLIDVLSPEHLDAVDKDLKATVENLGVSLASPATMLTLSKSLTVRVNMLASQAANIQSGEVDLQFKTEHTDATGQALKVPTAFLIAIPVFRNAVVRDAMLVRLRYRVQDGGKVMWSFVPYRYDLVLNKAFTEACTLIQSATDLPLFFGSPEA